MVEDFKILEEKINPLFKRKEILISINAEITPSRADTKKLISENFSTSIPNIRIKKILGKFGSKSFKVSANIYDSEEDLKKIEPKLKREKQIEEVEESQTSESSDKSSEENNSVEQNIEKKVEVEK